MNPAKHLQKQQERFVTSALLITLLTSCGDPMDRIDNIRDGRVGTGTVLFIASSPEEGLDIRHVAFERLLSEGIDLDPEGQKCLRDFALKLTEKGRIDTRTKRFVDLPVDADPTALFALLTESNHCLEIFDESLKREHYPLRDAAATRFMELSDQSTITTIADPSTRHRLRYYAVDYIDDHEQLALLAIRGSRAAFGRLDAKVDIPSYCATSANETIRRNAYLLTKLAAFRGDLRGYGQKIYMALQDLSIVIAKYDLTEMIGSLEHISFDEHFTTGDWVGTRGAVTLTTAHLTFELKYEKVVHTLKFEGGGPGKLADGIPNGSTVPSMVFPGSFLSEILLSLSEEDFRRLAKQVESEVRERAKTDASMEFSLAWAERMEGMRASPANSDLQSRRLETMDRWLMLKQMFEVTRAGIF